MNCNNTGIRFYLVVALVALLLPVTAMASLRLPHVLSDHAVLQRNGPIHIWGWATPAAILTVHFHKQTVSTAANSKGEWSLYLSPEVAGGPYTLSISGDKSEITLHDLLVGDVWIASGQSNMEFPLQGFPGAPLKNEAAEIAKANQPMIHLLRLDDQSSDTPLADQQNVWTTCTPATAKNFSAIAYFFGKELSEHEHIPIGLIDSSWGGTPAEPWLSFHAYGQNPLLIHAWASWARFADKQADLNATEAAEKKETEDAIEAGRPKPYFQWHPFAPSWQPAGLYNAMIAPLTPFSVRGFIWDQGETNSAPDRAPYYSSLMSALITDWRERFAQGMLPFLYVQISSFSSPHENWGELRDQQRRDLRVANTGMAVTLDLGEANNVHIPDKQAVGARLALIAKHLVYGEQLVFSGPLYRETTRECGADRSCALRVWFNDANGLTSLGKPMDSFEVAGPDGNFVAAHAQIQGDTVLLRASSIPDPVYVRFGWSSVVDENLFNSSGLPASTFSSEPDTAP